jgi:hypothetical protein
MTEAERLSLLQFRQEVMAVQSSMKAEMIEGSG